MIVFTFRIPFIIHFIRKIFRSSNPTNESTQVELAKFMLQFIDPVEVDADSKYCLTTVESAKTYNISEYLKQLQLDVPQYIDSRIYRGIQQNTLMCSDNTGEMDILRKRLLRFSYKIKIIQHYFYHCKDVNITRLFAKLLTRIWWIYHLSSPIMQ